MDNKADIHLIYPPTNAVTVMPSLGLGYLAGALRNDGFGVAVHDMARRHLRLKDLHSVLAAARPKYVGLSVSTPNYMNAVRVAAMIQRLPYRPTVLLGGPHVSVYPEEALKEFAGRYVVLRESEQSLVNLLNALESGADPASVRGICFYANGRAIETPPQPRVNNLDEIAWPAWDLLAPHRYPPVPHQLFVRELPVAPVITTRGCPFDCKFCASTFLFGSKIRRRSARDVADEMTHLAERFGIREFHIEDDNPTIIREHIVSLCEEMISRKRKFLWKFPNGIMVRTVDESLLRLLKEAGCYQISLGIETANREIEMGKDVPLRHVDDITETARRIGIQTVGLFVLGLPDETPRMMLRTISHSLIMGLDFAHYGIYQPLPGSRWGNDAQKENRNFRGINFFSSTQRSPRDNRLMKRMQRRAVFSFYIRPRIAYGLLRMLKPRQIPGFLQTFRRYVIG
jgi:anaerobic magnesium-protoporphyrin IX monomethyl ester cyclase